MIEKLKQDYPKSFFKIISEDSIFGEWNKEKTIFTFKLSPKSFGEFSGVNEEEHIIYLDDYINGYDYNPGFKEKLELLEKIYVINNYKLIKTIEYKNDEYGLRSKIGFSYKEKGGEYEIKYNIDKLKLFEKILYGISNIKLNIKKGLLKTILYLIEKEKSDGELNKFKIFDIEIILDELDIDDDKYIFNDIELLVYSLSLYEDKKYIDKFLDYLIKKLKSEDKDILVNVIEGENDLSLIKNKEIGKLNKVIEDNNKKSLSNNNLIKDITFQNDNNLYVNGEKRILFEPKEKKLISILKKKSFIYKNGIECGNGKELSLKEILNERDVNNYKIFENEKSIISAKDGIQVKIKKEELKKYVIVTGGMKKKFKIEIHI